MNDTTRTSPLVLDDVSLTLGDGDREVVALDHVDLSVARGELVAVAGPSGSGKSSLLAVAGGLLRPDEGRVVVDGTDIAAIGDRERTRIRLARIGFVFQSSNLVPALTAEDQLLLMEHLSGRSPKAAVGAARELLREVGVEDKGDRRPHQLSGGERQRVGIARALMTRPAVVLADEPTSALDHERALEIVGLLAREAHDRGVAALMVTHDPALLPLADRVLRMADGQLTEDAPSPVAAG